MNRYIDHTCLKQGATKKDILTLCQEANEHKFKAVCVPPSYVKLSKLVLSPWEVRKHIAHNQANLYEYILMEDSGVKVCTVIGFPLGYSSTASKAIEIKNA